jgi:prepilin-type N-terminal cleavage/methylation domain-containing protein
MKRSSNKAFTLIELLIVVLIIAILAAIAIPNFMEFQTRAKVSRIKNDMRTVATALEAYCVDEGTYPFPQWSFTANSYLYEKCLTTPIAYLTTIPVDVFKIQAGEVGTDSYLRRFEYGAGKAGQGSADYADSLDCWLLESSGPDGQEVTYPGITGPSGSAFNTGSYPWVNATLQDEAFMMAFIYDPTNGTVSWGGIQRIGGAPLSSPPHNVWTQAIR